MTTCSNRQQQYLNLQKRHHFLIHFFRILILVVFLILWEWTSQSGMIDSFVFGSPSKIARCFWNMVLDKTIDLSAAFAYNCAPSLEITSILGYFDNHSFTSLVFRVGIKSIIL